MASVSLAVQPVKIEKRVLKNGLNVFVVEDHSAPVAAVQVWYRVGSRNESYGITGISHVLEHMMFRFQWKGVDFSQYIDRMGGRDNAFTTRDATAYYEVVPSNRVEEVLQIEAARMRKIPFTGFDEEVKVVQEERRWRTENMPSGITWEMLFATAFIAHPYRHPVIGWMSDLQALKVEDVKSYYRTYYAPNNAALIVVGDVKAEDIFRWAEKYFGKYEPSPDIPEVRTREPKQLGRREAVVKKEGFTKYLVLAWHIPESKDPSHYALDVLSAYLSYKTSPLYEKLVKGGLATSYWAGAFGGIDPTLFVVWVTLQPNTDYDPVESVVLNEIKRLKEDLVPQEYLKRAKKSALVDAINQRESSNGLATVIGWSWVRMGDPEAYVNRYHEEIAKVTQEDVREVVRKYLDDEAYTVIKLVPVPPKDMRAFMEGMKKAQEFKR